jgi:hypothetical protein
MSAAERGDVESRLVSGSRLGALAVALLGVAVLGGWWLEIELLKRLAPGLVAMKFNTACGFVATGGALLALRATPVGRRRRTLGSALAALVAALGALTLLEYLAGVDLGIDQLLWPDEPSPLATAFPGRMASGTAVSFLLLGVALLALDRSRLLSRAAAGGAHLLATLALVGYAYGVSAFYGLGAYTSMALNTAAGLWVASLSILAARPAHGFLGVVVSRSDGGRMARWLLPAIPAAIFLLGWLGVAGARAGLYDHRFGIALTALLGMVLSAAIIAWQAGALHRVDLERQRGEREIVALNAGLERRVAERTAELEAALAQVKQLQGLLPICAWCKKIRDGEDYWHSVEDYISHRTDARFSHGVCPDCLSKALAGLQRDDPVADPGR